MENSGWIKLHRSILQWDWWDDKNTTRLFMYLLMSVNHKEKKWHGKIVPRGSLVTSRAHLSEETGISPQSLRTSLERLKSTSEITSESTSGFTLISICNYEKYQDQSTSESTSHLTNDQQTINKRSTTTKECKNERIEEIVSTPAQVAQEFFTKDAKRAEVVAYLSTTGMDYETATAEVEKFCRYWTEPSRSGKKERWELERTFDVKRRLVTWLERIKNNPQKSKGGVGFIS